MDDLRKDLRISALYDYYGDLLTDKQKNFIDLYYNEDLSLSEIAEQENITRQGVRDGIKHAEQKLFDYESKLKLAERSETFYKLADKIIALSGEICSAKTYSISAAKDKADKIEKLMKKHRELF